MNIDNELSGKFQEYIDDKDPYTRSNNSEVPDSLVSDVEEDILYLFSNVNISKEESMELLKHVESNISYIESCSFEEEWLEKEEWIEYKKIEILTYRLFVLDKCNKKTAGCILQNRILVANKRESLDRKQFEKMLLQISIIIPNVADYLNEGISHYFLNDCLQMIKVTQNLQNGNYVKAYDLYKAIMVNLINNQEWYIQEFTCSEDEDELEDIKDQHHKWIISKISRFIMIAVAANRIEDLKGFLEIWTKGYQKRKIDIEMIIVDIELFIYNDFEEYNNTEAKLYIEYFEGLHLLQDEKPNIELLVLYIRLLEKIIQQTDFNKEELYETYCTKLLDILKIINDSNPFAKYQIENYSDYEIFANLSLCLYDKQNIKKSIDLIRQYQGNNNFIRNVFKPIVSIRYDPMISYRFNADVILLEYVKLYKNVTYIEQLLKVTDYSKDFAYYTTLQTFSYLLLDDRNSDKNSVNQANKYRLSIMNEGYMNDPNEGKVFKDVLINNKTSYTHIFSKLIGSIDKKSRKQYNDVLVFLKSFSDKVDKLTMWSEYGDKGKGCCIVVDGETFRSCYIKSLLLNNSKKNSIIVKDDYNLYNVAYWNSREDCFMLHGQEKAEIKEMINMIGDGIVTISEQFDAICDDNYSTSIIIRTINELLSKIMYLIKYDEYVDESEVRLVFKRDTKINNQESINTIENNENKLRSMLYMHYPMKTIIKEVILGPKVIDSDNYAPFITMKLSEINRKCDYVTRLSISSIDYR